MCWVIRIAGASAGIGSRNSRIASVPPVDAPTMNSFSLETRGATSGCAPAGRLVGRRRVARAAPLIFSTISWPLSTRPRLRSSFGLVTKSTAPSSNACNVISDPRSVSDESMITGMGRRRMSLPRKSSPSIRGISTSRVSTSGLCCLINSRATSGSGAVATISISSSLLTISVTSLRINAESSTQRTRIARLAVMLTMPSPYVRVSQNPCS